MICYKTLLSKYMASVIYCEGTALIPFRDDEEFDSEGFSFTEEEYKELIATRNALDTEQQESKLS